MMELELSLPSAKQANLVVEENSKVLSRGKKCVEPTIKPALVSTPSRFLPINLAAQTSSRFCCARRRLARRSRKIAGTLRAFVYRYTAPLSLLIPAIPRRFFLHLSRSRRPRSRLRIAAENKPVGIDDLGQISPPAAWEFFFSREPGVPVTTKSSESVSIASLSYPCPRLGDA